MKELLAGLLFLTMVAAETKVPFWKAKPELYKKIKEDRLVVVSAKSESPDGVTKKLILVTAGIAHAPVDHCHKVITDFGKYADYVPYVQESAFDKTTQNLFIKGALLGYAVTMTIHIKTAKTKEGYAIEWESISGQFQGMKGTILEEPTDPEHSEISMESSYEGKPPAVPSFILNWGLEFGGQRAISAMRTQIESQWEGSIKEKH